MAGEQAERQSVFSRLKRSPDVPDSRPRAPISIPQRIVRPNRVQNQATEDSQSVRVSQHTRAPRESNEQRATSTDEGASRARRKNAIVWEPQPLSPVVKEARPQVEQHETERHTSVADHDDSMGDELRGEGRSKKEKNKSKDKDRSKHKKKTKRRDDRSRSRSHSASPDRAPYDDREPMDDERFPPDQHAAAAYQPPPLNEPPPSRNPPAIILRPGDRARAGQGRGGMGMGDRVRAPPGGPGPPELGAHLGGWEAPHGDSPPGDEGGRVPSRPQRRWDGPGEADVAEDVAQVHPQLHVQVMYPRDRGGAGRRVVPAEETAARLAKDYAGVTLKGSLKGNFQEEGLGQGGPVQRRVWSAGRDAAPPVPAEDREQPITLGVLVETEGAVMEPLDAAPPENRRRERVPVVDRSKEKERDTRKRSRSRERAMPEAGRDDGRHVHQRGGRQSVPQDDARDAGMDRHIPRRSTREEEPLIGGPGGGGDGIPEPPRRRERERAAGGGGERERAAGGGERERTVVGGERERTAIGGERERTVIGGERERTVIAGERERTLIGGDRERTVIGGERERTVIGGERERTVIGGQRERAPVGGEREKESRVVSERSRPVREDLPPGPPSHQSRPPREDLPSGSLSQQGRPPREDPPSGPASQQPPPPRGGGWEREQRDARGGGGMVPGPGDVGINEPRDRERDRDQRLRPASGMGPGPGDVGINEPRDRERDREQRFRPTGGIGPGPGDVGLNEPRDRDQRSRPAGGREREGWGGPGRGGPGPGPGMAMDRGPQWADQAPEHVRGPPPPHRGGDMNMEPGWTERGDRDRRGGPDVMADRERGGFGHDRGPPRGRGGPDDSKPLPPPPLPAHHQPHHPRFEPQRGDRHEGEHMDGGNGGGGGDDGPSAWWEMERMAGAGRGGGRFGPGPGSGPGPGGGRFGGRGDGPPGRGEFEGWGGDFEGRGDFGGRGRGRGDFGGRGGDFGGRGGDFGGRGDFGSFRGRGRGRSGGGPMWQEDVVPPSAPIQQSLFVGAMSGEAADRAPDKDIKASSQPLRGGEAATKQGEGAAPSIARLPKRIDPRVVRQLSSLPLSEVLAGPERFSHMLKMAGRCDELSHSASNVAKMQPAARFAALKARASAKVVAASTQLKDLAMGKVLIPSDDVPPLAPLGSLVPAEAVVDFHITSLQRCAAALKQAQEEPWVKPSRGGEGGFFSLTTDQQGLLWEEASS